jgi:hypothetical protein
MVHGSWSNLPVGYDVLQSPLRLAVAQYKSGVNLCGSGVTLKGGVLHRTSYPDFMDICVPFCGAAKTSLITRSSSKE